MRVDDNSHKSQLLSTLILVWPGLYAASCLQRTETESARTSNHISLTLSLAENSHVRDFFNTKFSGYFFKIAKLKRYQKVLFFFISFVNSCT